MIRQIVLDLDDVLNDFTIPCLRFLTGRSDLKLSDFDPDWGFNMHRAFLAFGGDDIPMPDMWNRVPRRFWANAPRSSLCDPLITMLLSHFLPSDILIATSPTKCAECYAGKVDWIETNLPPCLHRQVAITGRKLWLDRRDRCIIDDHNEFRLGQTITVPRPWNHTRCDSYGLANAMVLDQVRRLCSQ